MASVCQSHGLLLAFFKGNAKIFCLEEYRAWPTAARVHEEYTQNTCCAVCFNSQGGTHDWQGFVPEHAPSFNRNKHKNSSKFAGWHTRAAIMASKSALVPAHASTMPAPTTAPAAAVAIAIHTTCMISATPSTSHGPLLSKEVKLEELSKYFHLPEKAVAKELGICLTSLKKLCRSYGITRWPFRKLKSLERTMRKVQTVRPLPLERVGAGQIDTLAARQSRESVVLKGLCLELPASPF